MTPEEREVSGTGDVDVAEALIIAGVRRDHDGNVTVLGLSTTHGHIAMAVLHGSVMIHMTQAKTIPSTPHKYNIRSSR